MENKKMPIEVIVEDDRIAVRCDAGEWNVGEKDNRLLWILGAIAFPEEHFIEIKDMRRQRQGNQKDLSFTSEKRLLTMEAGEKEPHLGFGKDFSKEEHDVLLSAWKAGLSRNHIDFITHHSEDWWEMDIISCGLRMVTYAKMIFPGI